MRPQVAGEPCAGHIRSCPTEVPPLSCSPMPSACLHSQCHSSAGRRQQPPARFLLAGTQEGADATMPGGAQAALPQLQGRHPHRSLSSRKACRAGPTPSHRGLRQATHRHGQTQQDVVAVGGQPQQPCDAWEGLGWCVPVHGGHVRPAGQRARWLEGLPPAGPQGRGCSTWGGASPALFGGAHGAREGRLGTAAPGTHRQHVRGADQSSRLPAGPGST